MNIETATGEQAKTILALEEGHFHDLKGLDLAPAKLTRTVSAFANAAGGEIYLGVDEASTRNGKKRTWRGFRDIEAANAHIQVIEDALPLGDGYSAAFLKCPSLPGYVLHILVYKSRSIIRASNEKAYLRKGAQSLPVDSDEKLRRLELDKGIQSFETNTVDVPVELVANSTQILEFLLDVVPTAEPEPWLRKQLLLREGKPTVGAVLLFAEDPQAVLPKRCGIKILRYQTRDSEGTRDTLSFDPVTIEGPLYSQIYSAVERTTLEVEGIKALGVKGLEKIRYPRETLHEIITNAVLHRDYSIQSDIQIRIFDNRIEVENPGRLPGHITTDNILSEQFARNGSLVRLINKFPNPPNKDVGEGLNTAFEAMRKLRLKDPLISEREHSVLVLIKHEPLASPEEAVMKYLESHEEIANRMARELTGITSENRMKEVFYRLRDRGLIERVPEKKGAASAWRKCC